MKSALREIGETEILDINEITAMATLGFHDWLEVIGDKIADIIASGQAIGKDAAAAIKDLGHEAIAKIIEASANIQVAADRFLDEVLPKILEKTKAIAAEGQEVVDKVVDSIVGILKKLGAKGLQMAIDWLEKNKDQIEQNIYDTIVAKIREALAEIGLNPGLDVEAFDVSAALSFKDWLETVTDKIAGIIEAGKHIGEDAAEAIKNIGQQALDELIEASISIQAAKRKFVEEVLPKILEKTKEIAGKGQAGANKVIDAIVGILKKLGASGLRFAMEWLEENKDEIGKNIYDMIVAKIQAALAEIGLKRGIQSYGMMETAEEYIKDALKKAAYAGYDAAVYVFDKMIEFLKVFGIAALRLAEKLVEANKCLVGAYVYGMAMGKVKSAIKMAAIGGIVG